MAAVLEKIGWSEEVEMLAKLIAVVKSHLDKKSYSWETFLPQKYVEYAKHMNVDAISTASVKSSLDLLNKVNKQCLKK